MHMGQNTDTTGMLWEEAVQLLARAGYRVTGIEVTRPQGYQPPAEAKWRVLRQSEEEPGFVRICLAQECGYEGRAVITPPEH
jgi:hypothetical protein